jgi:hypothetical protein
MPAPTIPDDELVAFADGALEPARAAALAQRVAADPALARQVEALRQSRRLLAAALGPVAAEPVPPRLLAAARGPAPAASRRPPARWAIAASVALLVGAGLAFWPKGGERLAIGPAGPGLMAALAEAPSGAEQPLAGGALRLIASHEAGSALCREFAWAAPGERIGGLACRGPGGWQVELLRALPPPGAATRPASSGDPLVREALELRGAGAALGPEAERAALARR